MIFWFSGTGNSEYVARQLANGLGDRSAEIAGALLDGQLSYELTPRERVGFVFPTHSWGPPPVVLKLVERLQLEGMDESHFTYLVTTCGDDVGNLVRIFKKVLARRGITLQAAHSVQMPNSYINMRGFDVDPDSVRDKKLHAAQARMVQVTQSIAQRQARVDVAAGHWAWLKSSLVYPLFVRWAMSDKKFLVEPGKCTRCGLCQRCCPMRNITMGSDGEPRWNHHCAMCLGCIHHCPTRAIQYGRQTQSKGRYHFPED